MLGLCVLLLLHLTGKQEDLKHLDPELVKRLREFVGGANGNFDTSNMATLAFLYISVNVSIQPSKSVIGVPENFVRA